MAMDMVARCRWMKPGDCERCLFTGESEAPADSRPPRSCSDNGRTTTSGALQRTACAWAATGQRGRQKVSCMCGCRTTSA